MYNILTGKNVDPLLAPDDIDLSIIWLVLSLNRGYKDKLLSLVQSQALGEKTLSAAIYGDLIGILRQTANTERILQAVIDQRYEPVLNAVMSMPEAKRGRPPRPKAEKVIRLEPKRKRGRPPGSKNKPKKKATMPRGNIQKNKPSEIRFTNPAGQTIKRRRGYPKTSITAPDPAVINHDQSTNNRIKRHGSRSDRSA